MKTQQFWENLGTLYSFAISLALFTYSHVLFFINMLEWGRGQVLMISRVDLKT